MPQNSSRVSVLSFEPWSQKMTSGVSFTIKYNIPTIPSLPSEFSFSKPSFQYDFAVEKRIIEMTNETAQTGTGSPNPDENKPPIPSLAILEPTRENLSTTTPPPCSSNTGPSTFGGDKDRILLDFDATHHNNDPFHAAELRTINDMRELQTVLSLHHCQPQTTANNADSISFPKLDQAENLNDSIETWTLVEKPPVEESPQDRSALSNIMDNASKVLRRIKSSKKTDASVLEKASSKKLLNLAQTVGLSSTRARRLLSEINENSIDDLNPNLFISAVSTYTMLCEELNIENDIALDAACRFPQSAEKSTSYARIVEEFVPFGFTFENIYNCIVQCKGQLDRETISSALMKMSPDADTGKNLLSTPQRSD